MANTLLKKDAEIHRTRIFTTSITKSETVHAACRLAQFLPHLTLPEPLQFNAETVTDGLQY